MPESRLFFDWTKPILPRTATYLEDRYAASDEWDLRNVIVVLPTAQAGDRLLDRLVENAGKKKARLVPPRLITLFDLPELLYTPKRPFADLLTQQFAWMMALEKLPAAARAQLMRRLADATLNGRLAFASMMRELHRELAANVLSFAHVAEHISAGGEPREIARWDLLKQLERAYLKTLDDLELWDRQTARLVALEQKEFTTKADVILVGTVDLNASQRAMLEQIRERVTAIVAAPEERADWFDDLGILVVKRWVDARLDGIYERTEVVDGPDDQALAVCRILSEWNGRFSAEEISIGVPDRRIVPAIEQRLAECGLLVHNDLGRPLMQTSPARLLNAVVDYLESGLFRDFANLARHPDVELWLAAQGVSDGWLSEMDDYASSRFPNRLADAGFLQKPKAKGRDDYAALRGAALKLEAELKPLRGPKQPVTKWVSPVRELLLSIYGFRELRRDREPDRTIWQASRKIQDVLSAMEELLPELDESVTGAEALELVLHQIETQSATNPPGDNELCLSGWLDLPWDDSTAVIVTGFNEGIVPESKNPDAFLPDGLRRQMDLDDNERRFARDAYALSLLAASRKELRLIAGRRTEENDPLTPSRLVFACDAEDLPARVLKMFSRPMSLKNRLRISDGLEAGKDHALFEVPRPEPLAEPVTSMRVTEFSAYLECPYRYYLAHRLNLQSPGGFEEELPPNAFGDLIHDVLEAFGLETFANSSLDPKEIYTYLSDTLNTQALEKYGERPLPAIRIQIEQARLRLKAFADWQASWAADGWQILFAEQSVRDERAHMMVDESPMRLRGRIDRIDVREQSGGQEIAILDYKTADSGYSPEDKHRDRDQNWIDLQLPLYRHLIRAVDDLPETEAIRLGYIVLPKKSEETGDRLADWSEEDLAKADETAADVIRNVRDQIFWPPNPKPRYFTEFAAICQDDLFGTAMQEESDQ